MLSPALSVTLLIFLYFRFWKGVVWERFGQNKRSPRDGYAQSTGPSHGRHTERHQRTNHILARCINPCRTKHREAELLGGRRHWVRGWFTLRPKTNMLCCPQRPTLKCGEIGTALFCFCFLKKKKIKKKMNILVLWE